ncbi:hypothetical protein JQ615_21530 [Bradyrhizobium jicamae]|uniref:Uncharacterized protein n=1 Tax=Bradyrhizobium jicamae TaxID=280332 RepID=A0ABS5FMG8_9BRAD|nr:hypothetical protein [Bradyrhizobium jicamae]MBR0797975.1 hypothetical protein [Bradyrhizobium jicamae]
METPSFVEHSKIVNLGSALAMATAEWLAAKAQSGFTESLMSEALLIIPLVEYFTGHGKSTGWNLTGESPELGHGLAKPGDVNIDLVAERGEEKVLLEFKYLKKVGDQRLIKDMVKLAFPKGVNYARLLLVAHSASCQAHGQSKSPLVRAITSADRPAAFQLAKQDSLAKVRSDLDIGHSLTGDEEKHVSRIMSYDPSLADFVVGTVGDCRNAGENVSVFSVSRL